MQIIILKKFSLIGHCIKYYIEYYSRHYRSHYTRHYIGLGIRLRSSNVIRLLIRIYQLLIYIATFHALSSTTTSLLHTSKPFAYF